MTRRGSVERLFEPALVHGADGELGAAEPLRLDALGVVDGVLGADAAGPAADLSGPVRPLVRLMALAPLLGAIGVVGRHPDHRDRGVDAGQRPDAWDAAPGPHDQAAVDVLAQDGVRAADVAASFWRDGRRLDPEPELAQRLGGGEHDLVAGPAALLEREVEVTLLDRQPDHVRLEEAQRLEEQLLPGLVAVQDGNGWCGHRPNHMARCYVPSSPRPSPARPGAA